ncbi:hypothetical protein MNBD_GAMMA08-2073 [hydrothermal vent metagenome]|uniref:Uncharacterized protein n=1 Tax=hydrothermal vent metagenome TaxID=652676 RepID=A0A3B0XUQ1_9ZZZZ
MGNSILVKCAYKKHALLQIKMARDDKKEVDPAIAEARKSLQAAERFSFKTPAQVLAVSALIIWGMMIKPEEYLTAESGLGYALGIIGGVMMLLLLLYPVRKKMKVARYLGSVPAWFKFHMFCGVFGPIAVLYHSNYTMGSLNSSVALWCMIIVASSGLFGRYFYSKIHYGLYGRKASVDELSEIIDSEEDDLSALFKLMPDVAVTLKNYQKKSNELLSFSASVKRFFVLGFELRKASFTLRSKLKKSFDLYAEQAEWTAQQKKSYFKKINGHLQSFINAMIRTCEFSIYERLFALWHMLHYPLFLMLVVSGFVHVFAVHLY